MDKKVAMDFSVGLTTILFIGIFLITTGFAISWIIENVELIPFLQSTHYILIVVLGILLGLIVSYAVGRITNQFLESRGIHIY